MKSSFARRLPGRAAAVAGAVLAIAAAPGSAHAYVPAAGSLTSTAPASTSLPQVPGREVLWPRSAYSTGAPTATTSSAPAANTFNMFNHGGLVEQHPSVYVVYWGTEFQDGFNIPAGAGSYTSQQFTQYINTFFANVGGSPYNDVQTQYCQNVPAGTFDCSTQPYAQYIHNPTGILKGVWVDPTPVPATIVTTGLQEHVNNDPLDVEAIRAAQHFGYDIDATYFIYTPPGHAATAYGSVYCAYHSEVWNIGLGSHGVKYAFMPWQLDQGCATNAVNATDDAFGHGIFDGFSIVSGHEFAEAETDPDTWPYQDGWNNSIQTEDGDLCAYFHMQNVNLGSYYFAVQPLWSNSANNGTGGCAVVPGSGYAPVPLVPIGLVN